MSWVSINDDNIDKLIDAEHMLTRPAKVDASASKARPASERGQNQHLPNKLFANLEEACQASLGLDRYYVPLAICLAAETGLYLSQILSLIWQQVDLVNRRLDLPRVHKDGWRRRIVLPYAAHRYLKGFALSLEREGRFHSSDPLIGFSTREFMEAWSDIAERASVRRLPFHVFRTEAELRFKEAGLTAPELALMLGCHRPILLNPNRSLAIIQDKLDRHLFDGLTLEEAYGKLPVTKAESLIAIRELMIAHGVMDAEPPGPDVIRHFPPVILSKLPY